MRIPPWWQVGLVLLGLLLSAAPAWAQRPGPAEFRVVVEVRGKRAWGRRALSRRLRRTLADEIGELRSSLEFRRAQRRLKIPRAKQTYPSQLSRAAREVAADFVVFVRISRPKGRLSAKGYLIDTEGGKIIARRKIPFAKPADAGDVGRRMARRMVRALREIETPVLAPATGAATGDEKTAASGKILEGPNAANREAGESSATAVAGATREPPTDATEPAPPTIVLPGPAGAMSQPDGAAGGEPPPDEAQPTAADGAPATLDFEEPPDFQLEPDRPGLPTSGLMEPTSAPDSPSAGGATAAGNVWSGADTYGAPYAVRLGLGVGAGMYRDYALGSNAGDSGLSYDVPPVFMLAFSLQLDMGRVSTDFRGDVRWVGFDVRTDDTTGSPGGLIFDGALTVAYRLRLSDSMELRPNLGLRLNVLSVEEQDPDVLLSSTTLAPTLGVQLLVGRPDFIQLLVGADVGYIALYDESPTRTGDGGRGLTVGGHLEVRIWLSESLALTSQAHLTYDQIGFSGAPTRALLDNEAAQFEDADLSIIDTTLQFGVLLQL